MVLTNIALRDWEILLIAIAVVGTLGALVAIKTRPAIDVNRDGSVNPSEVPIRVENNFKKVIVDGPGLYDLTIESLYRTLLQSFMHAFCYGCQMVFLCNWTMAGMDRRYAYIITVSMVFKACMFMCMYSNNGIHIVTKHVVHFIYYGCAFLSLFFYWWAPVDHSGLVAVYALAILVTYTAGRYYALPNYPNMQQIIRLYKLDRTSGDWVLGSTPQLLSGDIATEVEPKLSEYTQWACTFPAFEIFNTHISSSFTWGVLVAVIIHALNTLTDDVIIHTDDDTVLLGVAMMVALLYQSTGLYGITENKLHLISSSFTWGVLVSVIIHALNTLTDDVIIHTDDDTVLLGVSIGAAMMVALLYQSTGLYGITENKLHLCTLSRFWPRSTSMLAAALGAASTVVNLTPPSSFTDPDEEDDEGATTSSSSTIVNWVGHGALIVAILMT